MAATVDAHVTVGFVVKDDVSPYLPAKAGGLHGGAALDRGDAAEQAGWREEGARGLLRLSSFSTVPTPVEHDWPCGGEIDVAEHAHLTPGVKRLIKSVKQGLKAFQEPEAATEGLGGTYFFMNDLGRKIAIFKPCDEEPLAPNNPKGFVGRQLGDPGLKPTVRVGEAATREVAAYLLDHDHFARVPHTVMVTMTHPAFHTAAGTSAAGPPTKLGSLQEFVPHDCDTSEMGASRFSVRDVHRIGILDIRLMNTDRHAGNMLVRRPRASKSGESSGTSLLSQHQYELIPIDHGFALPEAFEPPYFEWQHWPQAMMPFGKEELEYIARLDVKKDVELLRRELPSLREETLRTLEVATTLLKRCAAAGMSLAEIATVVTRPLIGLDEEPSELEKICCAARVVVEAAADAELSDSDDSEDGGSEDEDDVDALMSPVDLMGSDSPTSSASDCTRFQISTQPSDASRLAGEEALFNLDEEVASRSPGASPKAALALARTSGSAALALAAKAAAGQPSTPVAVTAAGVTFASPISTVASLGASLESMSLRDGFPGDEDLLASARSLAPTDSMSGMSGGAGAGAFMGAASCYGPGAAMGFHHTGAATAVKAARQRRTTGRRRRRGTPTGQMGKRAQYPPLVEARCTAPGAIFAGLTPGGWEHFMLIVRHQIDAALMSGTWKQGAASNAPPPASCPRF